MKHAAKHAHKTVMTLEKKISLIPTMKQQGKWPVFVANKPNSGHKAHKRLLNGRHTTTNMAVIHCLQLRFA